MPGLCLWLNFLRRSIVIQLEGLVLTADKEDSPPLSPRLAQATVIRYYRTALSTLVELSGFSQVRMLGMIINDRSEVRLKSLKSLKVPALVAFVLGLGLLPFLQFKSFVVNQVAYTVVLCLPLLAAYLHTMDNTRRWRPWTDLWLTLVFLITLLFAGGHAWNVWIALRHGELLFKQVDSIDWQGYQVVAYQDGTVPLSSGYLVLQQEKQLLPGLVLFHTIAIYGMFAEWRIIPPDYVRVKSQIGAVKDYRLNPWLYF